MSTRRSLLAGLAAEEDVDLFLDPILVVGSVGRGRLVIDETGKVGETIDEVEELGDVVCDGGGAGVLLLEVFFENLAYALHAFVDGFVVGPRARLRTRRRLNEQNRVRHSSFSSARGPLESLEPPGGSDEHVC